MVDAALASLPSRRRRERRWSISDREEPFSGKVFGPVFTIGRQTAGQRGGTFRTSGLPSLTPWNVRLESLTYTRAGRRPCAAELLATCRVVVAYLALVLVTGPRCGLKFGGGLMIPPEPPDRRREGELQPPQQKRPVRAALHGSPDAGFSSAQSDSGAIRLMDAFRLVAEIPRATSGTRVLCGSVRGPYRSRGPRRPPSLCSWLRVSTRGPSRCSAEREPRRCRLGRGRAARRREQIRKRPGRRGLSSLGVVANQLPGDLCGLGMLAATGQGEHQTNPGQLSSRDSVTVWHGSDRNGPGKRCSPTCPA